MNYNLLIYYALSFASVVKAGGFSAAAKQNNVSKAQLSRHVRALEQLLNIQLLHRTTRAMSLTEQGQQFFEMCESIENQCAEAVHQLKYDAMHIQGTLKITAPIDFGIQFLTPLVNDFSKQYPEVNVVLSLSNSNENLTEQHYDIGIRIAPQLPDSTLRVRTLMTFKRLICASPAYFAERKKPKQLEDLSQHRCITSFNANKQTLYPQWQFLMKGKPVNYPLKQFIEIDSLLAQIELIKQGAGIGRMPDYLIKDALKKGELIELFSDVEKPSVSIYLLYPDTIALPQKTRVFIDFIKDKILTNLD